MKVEWTEDRVAIAAVMWAEGALASVIAERIGTTKGNICKLAMFNRDRFPQRRAYSKFKAGGDAEALEPEQAEPVVEPRMLHPDRVTRITREGVAITMPRVTFIDGPAARSGQ